MIKIAGKTEKQKHVKNTEVQRTVSENAHRKLSRKHKNTPARIPLALAMEWMSSYIR